MRMQTCHSMKCARVRHKARPQHTACSGGGGGGGGESKQSGSAWPGLSAAMDGRAEALCHRLSLGCEYSREIAARPRVGVGRRTRLHAHSNRSAKRWPPHVSAVELGVGRFRHLQQIHHVATPHIMLQHPHNMLQRRTTLSLRLAACRPPGSCRVNRARLLHVAASCSVAASYHSLHGPARHGACCVLHALLHVTAVWREQPQPLTRRRLTVGSLRCRTDGRAQTARRAAAACRTARPRR